MTPITPINNWFGLDPVYVPPPPSRTKAEIAEARKKPDKPTYVAADPINEDEEWFRHHNWQKKRAVVMKALWDAGTSTNSIGAFANCGSDCQVEWSEELQRYRICACYCHNRHCEPCMRAKSALITNNLREIMKKGQQKTHRFITLTLAHDAETPLKDQIKRLNAAYKKLRSTKEWKQSQKGGAATIEIKWAVAGPRKRKDGTTYHAEGGWHPHLHIISEGTYLNTYTLSNLWVSITGDSHIVDIRIISAEKDVAYYVGKYVTKGSNNEVWDDPKRAVEFVKATKGVRMCATFGTWRGYKLLAKPKEIPGQWKHVASLASLVRRANAGDQTALDLLVILTETQMYNPHKKRSPKPK